MLSLEDKKDMVATFKNRTAEAYGYALVDPINTLLIYEQMQRKDEAIYAAFGFNLDGIPPLRPTLGSRVSTFIVSTVRKTIQSRALASGRALEGLMQKGGVALFKAHSDASKFGVQTGTTHGGLLFSRSPTKFWHESVGMLRDVDMAGCYNNVIARLNIYWGRPVIYEPGQERWTLRQAVEFVKEHVDTDAWFIRVTGDIRAFPNALIPSTEAAITSENYREKLRTGKRRRQRQRVFHLEALRDPASVKGTRGSKLYAARVESGIVTAKTWLMISALPANWRKEYEELTVDSIIFYPTALVAGDGQQFDEISQRHESIDLPWAASLNMSDMEVVRREMIGTDYIALRYPIGQYAEKIGQYRKKAQEADGKGSGADVAWKVHANSMYGVLASSHLPTNNFVGANQVTAWARAEAFALSQALNAVQTITDGCTYRLDQIPACTYAECLHIKPDYPIRRAEAGDGIPFVDPATIPADDNGFTIWYRQHVKTFFEIEGSEYEELFATHNLEHKKTNEAPPQTDEACTRVGP